MSASVVRAEDGHLAIAAGDEKEPGRVVERARRPAQLDGVARVRCHLRDGRFRLVLQRDAPRHAGGCGVEQGRVSQGGPAGSTPRRTTYTRDVLGRVDAGVRRPQGPRPLGHGHRFEANGLFPARRCSRHDRRARRAVVRHPPRRAIPVASGDGSGQGDKDERAGGKAACHSSEPTCPACKIPRRRRSQYRRPSS